VWRGEDFGPVDRAEILPALPQWAGEEALSQARVVADRFPRHSAHQLPLGCWRGIDPVAKHRGLLLLMRRFIRNNGITEGFHTKMEVLPREAYGFRNFENYKLRVKVLCS
jgi:hypothetical protein